MHPSIRSAALATMLALMMAVGGAASAAPFPGGTANGDQQGQKSANALSPAVPAPRWVSNVAGFSVAEQALVLDDAGHILVHALHREPLEDRLVALNTSDGSPAWETVGISRLCTPVASDDGRIFALADPEGPLVPDTSNGLGLLALDSADGTPLAGQAYVPGDTDPFLGPCRFGLVLSQQDILLVPQKANGISEPFVLQAFDVSGNAIRPLWRIERDSSGPENSLEMPVLTADGRAVWIGYQDADDSLLVERLELSDGSVQATAAVPGREFGSGGDGTDNPFSAVSHSDGLVVQTENADGSVNLLRMDFTTGGFAQTGRLAQTWIHTVGDADPVFGGSFASIAVQSGTVYALSGPRQVVSLDAQTGEVGYTYDVGTDIRGSEPLVVDAKGNVTVGPVNGSALTSITPDGQLRYASPIPEELLGDEVTAQLRLLGPLGPDGTLYLAGQGQAAPPQPVIAAMHNGTLRLNETGDVIDGAIQLCRYLFNDGEARSVILSRNDDFPDILAGAPLAGDHSCILYTEGGPDRPINPRTLAEIDRVLAPDGPVRIVGGTNAVSAEAEADVMEQGNPVQRIGGANRLETALLIARIVAAENGTGTELLLAFAGNWPDAVTGGAWAAKTGTPVILTGTSSLSSEAATAIDELGARRVTIAGGTAVISEAAESAITVDTRRVFGPNRFATAADVATTLWAEEAADEAYVLANLEFDLGWALALAASPLSVRLCAPQVGLANGRYPEESREYLTGQGLEISPALFVLGDLNVITDQVVSEVELDIGRS